MWKGVFDARKKKARAAATAPAARTLLVASSECFEHSNKTTPYEPNVETCNFNAGIAASMMRSCLEGGLGQWDNRIACGTLHTTNIVFGVSRDVCRS